MNKKEKQLRKPKLKMIISAGSSFGNWMKILAANKFSVHPKYFTRALFVTFISIFFSPFIFIEKLIYNRKIKKTNVAPPVFIIGHMRSGTTFLHYLMGQDKQFIAPNTVETVFPWINIILHNSLLKFLNYILPKKRPMDNMHIKAEWPQEDEFAIGNLSLYSPNNGAYFPRNIETFYRKYSLFENVTEKIINKWKNTYKYYFQKLTFKHGLKPILSKSLVNSGRIDKLIEIFPDAKFIMIYRNPYKVFLSTMKLYKTFIFKQMCFHDISDEELEETILKLAKAGYNKYFENKNNIKKGNLIEIKFEELVKDPMGNLKRIYNELHLKNFDNAIPDFESHLERYKNYQADKYHINENLKNKIYSNFKKVFEHFNYSR